MDSFSNHQLETTKHRHEKSKNRHKRQHINLINTKNSQSIALDSDQGAWILTETGKVYWVGNSEQFIGNNAYLISYINVPVTSMALVPNTGNAKVADVFFGTENGAYYRKHNKEEIIKISGLNEAIQSSADKIKSRNKRDPKVTITTLSVVLLIRAFWNHDSSQYLSCLDEIRNNLIEERIVQRISSNSPSTSSTTELCIFDPNLPTDNSHLVIMPVVTSDEAEDEGIRISLVLTARCLYLQGFILTDTTGTQHYFHFAGNDIISNINDISHDNTYNLGFKGDYNSLGGNAELTWDDIYRSFQYIRGLTNFQNYRNNRNNIFRGESDNREGRRSLVNIILAASESLRTVSIRNHLGNMISNRNSINWRTDIQPQASNWNTNSRSNDISDIAILSPNAIGTIEPDISDQPSTSSSRPAWYSKAKEKKEEVCSIKKKDKNRNRGTRSIDDCLIINSIAFLTQDSSIGSTEAKKGSMWIGTNNGVYKSSDGKNYNKINYLDESVRSIDVDHQGSAIAVTDSGKLYYISIAGWDWNARKIDIPHKVLKVKSLLDDSNSNSNIKAGALYIGIERGIYFINGDVENSENPKIERFNGLDFPINEIKLDNEGSAYIKNDRQEIYHLNIHGWDSEKCWDENLNLRFLFNYNDEIIDKEKCKENEYLNDFFEVKYKFLQHDEIKLQLLPKTVFDIDDIIYPQSNTNKFKEVLLNFIKSMEQKNSTGVGGNILDSDYNAAADFIFNHFSYFKKLAAHLRNKERIQDKVLIIITNRAGYFQNDNIYIWNYKLSKKEYIKTLNNKDELRRLKRENVVINKNKWTEDFSKFINQEQHLLVTTRLFCNLCIFVLQSY